jgi:hypothetical protein
MKAIIKLRQANLTVLFLSRESLFVNNREWTKNLSSIEAMSKSKFNFSKFLL